MAEWLYEAGIGENRAALIEDGAIVEALIEVESDGPRAGAVHAAILRPRRIAELSNGDEVLLDAVPPRMAEGARLRVEITREALSEPGKPKRAKGRAVAAETPLRLGLTLLDQIGPHRRLDAFDDDLLEAAGWSELLEQAASGVVAFDENALTISPTPAMTLIDLDGPDPEALLLTGARAAAQAIRRLGIAGNIGIDFPTIGSRQLRADAAAAFKAALPPPFEATAINGFGFMQIIRPRQRASLLERAYYDRAGCAARALLRRAQRSRLTGAVELTANPAVARVIEPRADWLTALGAQLGGTVRLRSDATLGIAGGHVSSAR